MAALIDRAAQLRVLATSQELLKARGEHVYRVGTPAVPATNELPAAAGADAVALFVEGTSALQPGFALSERNAADMVDICRQLDGLPLAIELANALVLAEEELAIAREVGDHWFINLLLDLLQQAAAMRGDFEEAAARGEEIVASMRRERFPGHLGRALGNLSVALEKLGRLDEALAAARNTRGEPRHDDDRKGRDALHQALRNALGDGELNHLLARGATLDDEEAARTAPAG